MRLEQQQQQLRLSSAANEVALAAIERHYSGLCQCKRARSLSIVGALEGKFMKDIINSQTAVCCFEFNYALA